MQLVEDFAAAVQAELPRVEGEHVKTIGDAHAPIPDPVEAIRLACGSHARHGRPPGTSVRVGGNHGSAVERAGDYFGTTINVAARVSALARGGNFSSQGAAAALAAGLEGVLYEVSRPAGAPEHHSAGGDLFRRSLGRGRRTLRCRPGLQDDGGSRPSGRPPNARRGGVPLLLTQLRCGLRAASGAVHRRSGLAESKSPSCSFRPLSAGCVRVMRGALRASRPSGAPD